MIAQTQTFDSLCRLCLAMCPVKVDMENGRAVRVWGDKNNPAYHGYTCSKGRAMLQTQYHPDRILNALKRQPDGSYARIPLAQAINEIAAKMRELIERDSPRAIATYAATGGLQAPATYPLVDAFMHALGSPMRFGSATIDQPGKAIATALHGDWRAGFTPIDHADSWLMVGMNPLVSKIGSVNNPARVLNHAQKRGLKLIVIDPRQTETTRFAALHLQPRPGEDPTVLAGLLHIIFAEQLEDAEFLADNADGVSALRDAVAAFTPAYVEQRADVPAALLIEAARIYAAGQRGAAVAGTGPNMATHGNLTEYLLRCLMTVCGHWPRVGDRFHNPPVMLPPRAPHAEAIPPTPAWGYGESLRVRNLGDAACGMPTGALPDEILLEGKGHVRALFSVAGNPMMAWPDQEKTARALRDLELLVVLDLRMTDTAREAHYIIAPKYGLETPGLTGPHEFLTRSYGIGSGLTIPYAQYAEAIVEPPAGSELVDDWEFFYLLARELGLQLKLGKAELDMTHTPSTDVILEILYGRGRVPLSIIREQFPAGHVFEDAEATVLPKRESCTTRLQVGDPHMVAELAEVLAENKYDSRYPFRVISRRLAHVYNSAHREQPELAKGKRFNPAYMNPDDMNELSLHDGDTVQLESAHGAIRCIVERDAAVKRQVISLSHCFGAAPGRDGDVMDEGSNIARLIANDIEFDRITGIPRMSAIPVQIYRLADVLINV